MPKEDYWRRADPAPAAARSVGDGLEGDFSFWCGQLGDSFVLGYARRNAYSLPVELRRRFPATASRGPLNIGNGYASYLPPREDYAVGPYPTRVAVYEKVSMEIVLRAADRTIRRHAGGGLGTVFDISAARSLNRWTTSNFFLFVALLSPGWIPFRQGWRASSSEYFLAGRKLRWYVVGASYIAANISTEQFIGMVGASYLLGICPALYEWLNVFTFLFMIFIFIPFLLSRRWSRFRSFLGAAVWTVVRQNIRIHHLVANILISWRPCCTPEDWRSTDSSAGRCPSASFSRACSPAAGPSMADYRRLPGPAYFTAV